MKQLREYIKKELKTLKEVCEYFAVSIETYKNQQYEF